MASGPASPGTQASRIARAVGGRPFDRERPPADDDQDDRRAGRDDGLEQLLLATA